MDFSPCALDSPRHAAGPPDWGWPAPPDLEPKAAGHCAAQLAAANVAACTVQPQQAFIYVAVAAADVVYGVQMPGWGPTKYVCSAPPCAEARHYIQMPAPSPQNAGCHPCHDEAGQDVWYYPGQPWAWGDPIGAVSDCQPHYFETYTPSHEEAPLEPVVETAPEVRARDGCEYVCSTPSPTSTSASTPRTGSPRRDSLVSTSSGEARRPSRAETRALGRRNRQRGRGDQPPRERTVAPIIPLPGPAGRQRGRGAPPPKPAPPLRPDDARRLDTADPPERVLQLARDKEGCRTVQLALQTWSKRDGAALVNKLRGAFVELVGDPHGNYVIGEIFTCFTKSVHALILKELKGMGLVLAKHKYGCRILGRIAEHCSNQEEARQLIREVVVRANYLAGAEFACHAVVAVLQHVETARHDLLWHLTEGPPQADVEPRYRFPPRDLHELATNRYASRVVEAALTYAGDGDRRRLLQKLTKDWDWLPRLVEGRPGFYVAKALLRLPEYGDGVRVQLWKDADRLTGKYGKILLKEFGVGVLQ